MGEEAWEEAVEQAEERMASKGDNYYSRKAAKQQRLREWRGTLQRVYAAFAAPSLEQPGLISRQQAGTLIRNTPNSNFIRNMTERNDREW